MSDTYGEDIGGQSYGSYTNTPGDGGGLTGSDGDTPEEQILGRTTGSRTINPPGEGGLSSFFQTVGDFYNKYSPMMNIGKGIGSLFDKFADLRGFNPDGSRRTQEEYEEARQNRINNNRIANINMRKNPDFNSVLDGEIFDAENPYNFRNTMAEINLQRGITGRNDGVLSQAPSMMREFYNTPIENRIGSTSGFNPNNIDLTKTFGLEELLASGAAKKGMAYGYNLTDQGKALENFRKNALGMNNPKGYGPYKDLGVQFQLNQLIKNENKNAMENKNYIQEQINKGFLQNLEDFTNQKTLGEYL